MSSTSSSKQPVSQIIAEIKGQLFGFIRYSLVPLIYSYMFDIQTLTDYLLLQVWHSDFIYY